MRQVTVESYRQIDIDLPRETRNPEFAREIPLQTTLFREWNHLDMALSIANDRRANAESLRVVSAGCSIGAEADSILALHCRNRLGGVVQLRGYDVSDFALRTARIGKHLIPEYFYPQEVAAELGTDLAKWGMLVESDKAVTEVEGIVYPRQGYVVNAAPLRAENEVIFQPRDLVWGESLEAPADLVLANNVLYHLAPYAATRLIRNLAVALSEGGVLSLGDISEPDFRLMGGYRGSTTYHEWLKRTADMLSKEFDLEPVVIDPDEERLRPAIFARS